LNPTIKKSIAFSLIGLGGADLLFGNTGHAVLPDVIGNNLSQQSDAVLIALGTVLLLFF
jgi:hypothetical protein